MPRQGAAIFGNDKIFDRKIFAQGGAQLSAVWKEKNTAFYKCYPQMFVAFVLLCCKIKVKI
jgi:hypothetical protein